LDTSQHSTQALEKQNADLVDKNASIEEEYRKVAAFKPLMESYKTQISELESKISVRTKESETVRFELEQTRIKLKIANEERAKDSETLELYQERVRELELQSHQRPPVTSPKSPSATVVHEGGLVTEGETMAVLEDEDDEGGLGEELDTVLTGTTMTDLKLQVRRLKRELEAVQKNEVDSSRILVLENLLEDANRTKARYEVDYIAEHREKLVLQSAMEEIRSGKSMGDGYDRFRSQQMLHSDLNPSPEAAIALRQRLNETVEQLDELRRKHAELEVNFENQSKELTIAKSDRKS
jgi:protein HOOK3